MSAWLFIKEIRKENRHKWTLHYIGTYNTVVLRSRSKAYMLE
jgi:hypothetical protein